MNVRINVTIPVETVKKLKKVATKRGISRFLVEAAEEKIGNIERKKALKEILDAPPTFTFLKGKNASVRWVRKLRRADEKRLNRLWGNKVYFNEKNPR